MRRGDTFNNIVVPLYNSFREAVVKKTGDSIINHCSSVILDYRLLPFKISDNSLYYGGKGIILDSNNKVLFLATVNINQRDNMTIVEDYKVYVNPIVFVSKDIVSKTIVSKVIPIFIENNYTFQPVKLIIEDKSDIICTPVKPATYNVDEEINNFLVNNVSEIESLFNL